MPIGKFIHSCKCARFPYKFKNHCKELAPVMAAFEYIERYDSQRFVCIHCKYAPIFVNTLYSDL